MTAAEVLTGGGIILVAMTLIQIAPLSWIRGPLLRGPSGGPSTRM